MKAPIGIAAFALAFGLPLLAQAAEANGFGDKGQLILTGDRLLPLFSYTNVSTTQTQDNTTVTNSQNGSGSALTLGTDFGVSSPHTIPRVAADFTIIPHLTLGGALVFGFGFGGSTETETVQGATTTRRDVDTPTRTVFGIAPRVGYILQFTDILAFWPRAGFAFYSDRTKREDVDNNNTTTVSQTDTIFSLDLDPQLAIVPMEHLFFHVGPLVNIPITGSRSSKFTNGATTVERSDDLSVFHLGISAGLGGWFNL